MVLRDETRVRRTGRDRLSLVTHLTPVGVHVPGRLDARRGDRRSDRVDDRDTRVGACDLRYGYGGPVGRASVAARPARAVAVSHTGHRTPRRPGLRFYLSYACVHVEKIAMLLKTPPLHAALPRPNSLAKSYTSLRRTRNTGKPSPKT